MREDNVSFDMRIIAWKAPTSAVGGRSERRKTSSSDYGSPNGVTGHSYLISVDQQTCRVYKLVTRADIVSWDLLRVLSCRDSKMYVYYCGLFVVLLAASASAGPIVLADCPFPNGTDKAIHSYMCADGEQFSITDIQTTDLNGKPLYPIDPGQAFILNLTTYNHGPQIDDNKVNVKIYQYKTDITSNKCAWGEIPTFGLLNNIDGCDFAHNCPLTTGPLYLVLQMDLSQYSAIINLLAAYKPYELEIRLFNYNAGNTKHEEIACVMAQVELS